MIADTQPTNTIAATPLTSSPPADHEHMVILRPSGQHTHEENDALAFASWDAFMAANVISLGFFLDGWPPKAQADLAEKVRASSWWDRPVLVGPTADSVPPAR